jgi:PAS domain S-box-containing protein
VARDGAPQQEIEQRLLKAQRMAKVANYEFDLDTNQYIYASETLFEIFGLDRKKHPVFTSALFWSLVHPDDVNFVRESVQNRLKGETLEFRIIRPDGQVIYINRMREIIKNPEGIPIKTIGTLQDITDRKIGELAIKEREVRFRSLVQNGNDIIGVIGIDGKYSFVGANVQEHLSFRPEALLGKSALEFIHPDDQSLVAASFQEIISQQAITIKPFRFRNGNGVWRWIEARVSNHLNNPVIKGLVINSKDITEKKLSDDELRVSEELFRALVQNSSDLIVIIDHKANFSYLSDNVTAVLGYRPEEMSGKNAFDYIHPNDLVKVNLELERIIEGNEVAKGVEHRFLHKNGKWIWLESKGTYHIDNSTIKGILVNSRNIDDRVKLQKRLSQELVNKQKEITSAVITAQESERSQLGLELHDNVNQILTTVKLYNEMYLTGYIKDKQLLAKSSLYIQDCINEIRSISKRLSAPTLGKILLKDSIGELVESINLTKRIEISYIADGVDHHTISEDLHLAIYRIVQESLNNIIKYSYARAAVIEIMADESKLLLKISDNGKGFDEGKKSGGIGITNMKTRAENLNGNFQITSAPGQGCQIDVYFPLK